MTNVFRNITKSSLSQGMGVWIVLAAALGVALTQWGYLGFFLTGIPLWCFGILGAAGGTLFHLGPMLFESTSIHPPREPKTTEELFLYLRPFELDARSSVQLMVGASAGVLVYLGLLQELLWGAALLPLIVNVNKEQNFQDAFTSLGRFIAFGKPREWLRPLGASRVYMGDDWKLQIIPLMLQARLVIVRPGTSDSITWEIEELRELKVPPQRIVFYLKFRGWKKRREMAYQSFRDHLESQYPTTLPEELGSARFLIFDQSWQPQFIEDKNGPNQWLQQFFSRSGSITDNLRPLLKALDLELPVRKKDFLSNLWRILVMLITLPAVALIPLTIMYATMQILIGLALFLLRTLMR
jgi:hypothetical protein